MPIDLAPYDLILSDWGRPAILRQAADGLPAGPVIEHPVMIIPQTIRLSQTDTIAAVEGESRNFLIQADALPASLEWLDCELLVDNFPHRIIAAEDSGAGGWVLLETHATRPRSVA
jgi:hypothetical protein